ncbi:hypothetical protein MP228_009952 [Amoeboaphelidium protococcarum]|nr:hypothetical protein MP228_009952 [Amoeboaphelidium protococcarum]
MVQEEQIQTMKKFRQGVSASIGKSRIFQPFRALGHICDSDVPIQMQIRGSKVFITASLGRKYQVYNDQLRLMFVSQSVDQRQSVIPPSDDASLPVDQKIQCMALNGDYTYVGSGSDIIVYERAKIFQVMRYDQDNGADGAVIDMSVFGDVLVAANDDGVMRVWSTSDHQLMTEISFDSGFVPTSILHPSTYVNKVLVGSSDGRLQLWNIKSVKMLYEFTLEKKDNGSQSCNAIKCLAQSPVLDVVAAGLSNGQIVLLNLRSDQKLMSFSMDQSIKAIAFRTDNDMPVMVSGNSSGMVAVWNLEDRRIVQTFQAHEASVNSLHFIPKQPVLISSGNDNAIKMWVFDTVDGSARLLRSRSGHYRPPTQVMYYGEDGRSVLTAAEDNAVRTFCTMRDEQSVELSQGPGLVKKSKSRNMSIDQLKLPLVTGMDSSSNRAKDWNNILACHSKYNVATVWSFDYKRVDKDLSIKAADGKPVTAVCVSNCGNFGVIGTQGGQLTSVNMQSALVRRNYCGVDSQVVGVHMDALNKHIYSIHEDGVVAMWSFAKGICIKSARLPSEALASEFHKSSNFIAVSCEDQTIYLLEAENLSIVRKFQLQSKITSMTMSKDGRWLIASDKSGMVLTFDIPSGHLVDVFKCRDMVTSLSLSPTGDFLATTHSGQLGVYLWANKMQFSNVVLSKVDLPEAALSGKISVSQLPGEDSSNADDNDSLDEHFSDSVGFVYHAADQISQDMMTLSIQPKAKWSSLLSLDLIKKRNKPKEVPNAPEQAPFFLPVISGLKSQFDVQPSQIQENDQSQSSINFDALQQDYTPFMKAVIEANESGGYSEVIEMLKKMNSSEIDYEIRAVDVLNGVESLISLLRCLSRLIRTCREFELYQACLQTVLKVHSDVILEHGAKFAQVLGDLSLAVKASSTDVDQLFRKSLSTIQFVARY